MTAPVALPHFQLGNTATDLSRAAANFVTGLQAERDKRKAEAMQQALLGVHQLTAEAPLIIERTKLGVQHQGADYYRSKYPDLANAPDEPAIFAGQARERNELMRSRIMSTRRPIVGYDAEGNIILIEPDEASPQQQSPTQAPQTQAPSGQQPSTGHAPQAPVGQPVRPQSGWQNPKTHVVPGVGRSTTPGERNFAGAGRAAASAHNDLSAIENSPTGEAVVHEIAAMISRPNFAQLVPFRGQQLSHVLQQFRLAGASDQAQVYLKRLFDLAGTIGPKRYGL